MSTATTQPSSTATSQIITLPPLPELFDPNFLDILIPVTQNAPAPKAAPPVTPNAMIDALQSSTHQKLTTNNAPAFSSTRIPTLNAFLGLRTGIPGHKVDRYLDHAWEEDPNLTLRIIWSTRSIHDGKAEKELFYRAFGWLFENHPRTAITNLHYLVDPVCVRSVKNTKRKTGFPHGYWKDLLNILALATVDELRPKLLLNPRSNFLHNYGNRKSLPIFKNNQEQEAWSHTQRVERSRHAHDRVRQKLLDQHYRALYVAVARLFADQIVKEYGVMNEIAALPANANKKDRMQLMLKLTLVFKWAPTPGGSHDRVTNIASAICLLLHEAQVHLPVAKRISFSISTALPAPEIHLLRCAYQKHVLSRGRHHICVTESLMSSNRWSDIIYSRVSSICMNNNKGRFFKHDEGRFLNYLLDIESGKKKISGATLLPHVLANEAARLYCQIVESLNDRGHLVKDGHVQRKLAETQMRVVDAQWNTLVSCLRESGGLDNCIAVCDVSGSMGYIHSSSSKSAFDVDPIWPALSLSLLVARLAKPPFNDCFITFSGSPEFVTVEPESSRISLGETISGMNKAKWEMNTNFNAVFLKLILPLAIRHNVPQDQMIKRVFVFSDMQFDAAENTNDPAATEWKTNHDVIAEAYAQAGYDVPQLVYWDLSNSADGHEITAPVTGEREGVALLNGYSPSLLKLFVDIEEEEDWAVLDAEGVSRPERQCLTPEEFMKKALGRKCYDGLVVVD